MQSVNHTTFPLPSSFFQASSVIFSIAQFFADYKGTCLLYSGGNLDSAQDTFLGLFPYETVEVNALKLTHCYGKECHHFHVKNPWDALQEHFFSSLTAQSEAIAFGWFGYCMSGFVDEIYELPYLPSPLPDAYLQRFAVTLKLNIRTLEATVYING